MTRGLLLSVQYTMRNLVKIRAEVIHPGEGSLHTLDDIEQFRGTLGLK